MSMQPVYDFFGGRATTFAAVILALGTILAALHKLDMSYVGLAGAVQALVTFRAISEDHIGKGGV